LDIFKDKNNKKEMTKIILKSLSQMGFTKTIKKLSEESKIIAENDDMIRCRNLVLKGN